ncbi:hypothetical protein LTR22_013051 [Elasticomyces elasticus]|nr:hypothetical protein LTR22_013051 [Elasticomyces elasticus]KAK4908483.1 hypothetical protein LTR49_022630 [Elasticomyces elasticus]
MTGHDPGEEEYPPEAYISEDAIASLDREAENTVGRAEEPRAPRRPTPRAPTPEPLTPPSQKEKRTSGAPVDNVGDVDMEMAREGHGRMTMGDELAGHGNEGSGQRDSPALQDFVRDVGRSFLPPLPVVPIKRTLSLLTKSLVSDSTGTEAVLDNPPVQPQLHPRMTRSDDIFEETAPPFKKAKTKAVTDVPAARSGPLGGIFSAVKRVAASALRPSTTRPSTSTSSASRPTLIVKLTLPTRVADTQRAIAGVVQVPSTAAAQLVAVGDALITENPGLLLVAGSATITVERYLAHFPAHRGRIVLHLARLLLSEMPLLEQVVNTAEWLYHRVPLTAVNKKVIAMLELESLSAKAALKQLIEDGDVEDTATHSTVSGMRTHLLRGRLDSEFAKACTVRVAQGPLINTVSESPGYARGVLNADQLRLATLRENSGKPMKWADVMKKLNETLPEDAKEKSEATLSSRYRRGLQQVRAEIERVAREQAQSHALALQAAYHRDTTGAPMNGSDISKSLEDHADLVVYLGRQEMSIAQYLDAYPDYSNEIAVFLCESIAFRLPPHIIDDINIDLHERLKRWPETIDAPRASPDDTSLSLVSVLTQDELSVFLYRQPPKNRTRLTFQEIAQKTSYTEDKIWELYDSAMSKFELWSHALCFVELDRLGLYATEQQRHIISKNPGLEPDDGRFAPRVYEGLPEAIVRHIALERMPLLSRESKYREVLLALLQDDAEQGIAPVRPRALDIWSDLPAAHGFEDLEKLAQQNRSRLQTHLARNGGTPDEAGLYADPYQPADDTQAGPILRQASTTNTTLSSKGRGLHFAFGTRFAVGTPAAIPRFSDDSIAGHRYPHIALQLQMLMYLDAREGISPPRPSYGTTIEHQLSADQLRHRLKDREERLQKNLIREMNRPQLLAQLNGLGADTTAASITNGELEDIIQAMRPIMPREMAGAGVQVTSIATVPLETVEITESRKLCAPDVVRRNLERTVGRSMVPDWASGQGYLCGLRALLQSLRCARRYYDPSALPFPWSVELVMGCLFRDWDPAFEYPPNTAGTPTEEFETFLRDRLVQRVNLQPGTQLYEEQYQNMTTLNMSEQTHLQLVLEFMHEHVGLERQYALGVVTAGPNANVPATAHILSAAEVNDDTAVVWVYHDNAQASLSDGDAAMLQQMGGGRLLGHYSPFELYGDRVELVDSWGLRRPGAALLPSIVRRKSWTELSEDEKKRREDRFAQMKTLKKLKLARGCETCHEAGVTCEPQKLFSVKGKMSEADAKKCKSCFDLQVECDRDEPVDSPAFHNQAPPGLTGEQLVNWDLANPDWDEIERLSRLIIPNPLPPDITLWAFHQHIMRISSMVGANYVNTLIARLPGFRVRMQALQNSGNQTPEAQILHGQQMAMSFIGHIFQRRGILDFPTQITNGLVDPYLRAFVHVWHHFRHVAQTGGPLPYRVILSTSGVAGGQVGILQFGDRTRGFYQFVAQGSQALADRIWLVSIVQPHVYGGNAHSIPPAYQQHFSHFQGKWLISNPLTHLVDRNAALMFFAALNPPQAPPANFGAQYLSRLDAHILLLDDEHAWRAHHLAPTTVPTDQQVKQRNVGRNGAW